MPRTTMTTGMEICAIFHWVSDRQMMVCRPARGSRRITISLLGGQRREPVVIDGHSDPLQDDQGDSDYPYSNRDHPKILRGALLRLRSGRLEVCRLRLGKPLLPCCPCPSETLIARINLVCCRALARRPYCAGGITAVHAFAQNRQGVSAGANLPPSA